MIPKTHLVNITNSNTSSACTTGTAVVIFGASGDLAARKLIPAVYNLALDSLLPKDFFLIGFGRKSITDEAFRTLVKNSIQTYSRRTLDPQIWEILVKKIFYHTGDYEHPEAFDTLKDRLHMLESANGQQLQMLAYISTPPSMFKPILKHLGNCGLAARYLNTSYHSKIVLEKPFGRDLESAQDLNATLAQELKEYQIFRIDHYLGKESVQNLLHFRFENILFEPVWNAEYIDNVQITVAEELGIDSRGGYYDQSGALRDMIQNHTMQLLSLIAMEMPVATTQEAIRDEKVRLIQCIRSLDSHSGFLDTVRARYTTGTINKVSVKGYLQEDFISQQSSTETYAALRLSIDNTRWKGVPFYIRSGKRMSQHVSQIVINFKPHSNPFSSLGHNTYSSPNALVICIQPDVGIHLTVNAKTPGLDIRTQPVSLSFQYAKQFGTNIPEGYEPLLLNAMNGNNSLFIRADETEASWRLFTPLLKYWESVGMQGLESYAAGTWGPELSNTLMLKGHTWDIGVCKL